jgi:hypothetical protein
MTLYVIVILYVVINVVKFVKALFTTMPSKGYKKRFKEKLSLNIKTFLSKKRFIQIIAGMLIINIGLYWMSRYSWIDNKDAKYIKAKEYLVVGDVLSRQLEVLNTFIYPDSYKVRPLVWLLHGIYNLGVKYLPENDAEKAMWYYRFFIYPYAKKDILPHSNFVVKEFFRGYIPRFTGGFFKELPLLGELFFYDQDVRYDNDIPKDYREPQIKFLKKSFSVLKTISTKPIADKNMHRAYLLAYPGFAMYYSLNQSFYFNGRHSRRKLYKTPWYESQDKEEFEWFLAFEKNFDDPSIQKLYGKKLAKNKVLLYCAIINIAEDLIEMSYVNDTFSCDSKALKTYVRMRNLLIGKIKNIDRLRWHIQELKKVNKKLGKDGGILFKLSSREIDTIYNGYIEQFEPEAYKYIGVKICGYKVYGKVGSVEGYDTEERDMLSAYKDFLRDMNKLKKGEYK